MNNSFIQTKAKPKLKVLKQLVLAFIFLHIQVFISPDTIAKSNKQRKDPIRVYTGGWSPLVQAYQIKVISRIMALSQEQHGHFDIEIFDPETSRRRVLNGISKGDFADITFMSSLKEENDPKSAIEKIHFPMLQGILGLRRLIINKHDIERYNNLTEADNFLKLKPGQVTHWPDCQVFEYSGVKVAKSLTYEKLYPMLKIGRYDYLPLSIVEIDYALKTQVSTNKNLSIHHSLYIFYSIPIFIHVNKHIPRLLERTKYGMERIIESGELDSLFRQFFAQYLTNIDADSATVFVLNNPEMDITFNRSLIDNAMNYYFNSHSKIIHISKALEEK